MDYAEHLHRDHQPEHLHHLHHLRQTDSPRTAENSPKCSRTSNRSLSHEQQKHATRTPRGQNKGIISQLDSFKALDYLLYLRSAPQDRRRTPKHARKYACRLFTAENIA